MVNWLCMCFSFLIFYTIMPTVCSVKGCKSSWKKHSRITFHRFPPPNEKYFQHWIAATGREDLVSFANARICSLHFLNNDYFNHTKHVGKRYLKSDTFPTQHVHKNVIQLIAKADKINKEQTTRNNQNDEETISNQNNMLIDEEQTMGNNQNDEETISNQNDMLIDEEQSVISKCSNCEKLEIHNKVLQQEITDLEISQEKRLEQQASMFHVIINKKEAELKKDYIVISRVKNKFALDPSIFSNLDCDNVGVLDMPHKIRLIIAISSRYIKIRLHSYSKFYLQEILKPIRKRHHLTKQILFYRE